MTAPNTATSPSFSETTQDERREWMRIDDQILMEYRILSDSGGSLPVEGRHATAQDISAAVGKPTAELLARAGDELVGSPVLPWIMKVDYLLEVILNSLAASRPETVNIARPMDVNLSGGGVGFIAAQQIAPGTHLALKLILPPFTMIQTHVKVIRAVPVAEGQGCTIATEFVDLKPDDQEHVIRHILHVQAKRLRAGRGQLS